MSGMYTSTDIHAVRSKLYFIGTELYLKKHYQVILNVEALCNYHCLQEWENEHCSCRNRFKIVHLV